MSEFKRETRYSVFKLKNLTEEQKQRLYDLQMELGPWNDVGECVVVESDWPNYQDTWTAIKAVSEGNYTSPSELTAQRDNSWQELREIREAISANPEESTADEVRRVIAEREKALTQSAEDFGDGYYDGFLDGAKHHEDTDCNTKPEYLGDAALQCSEIAEDAKSKRLGIVSRQELMVQNTELGAYIEAMRYELQACQNVLHMLAHAGEVTPAYADDAKKVLQATPAQCLRDVKADAIEDYKAANPSVADHLVRQIAFSLKAFGPALRTGGVIDHIGKELKEVAENPHDLSEWIDLAMLALDGAWRHAVRGGRTHQDIAQQVAAALQAKLVKNENRTWPDWRLLSEDKAIEHDRTGESAGKVGEL